MIIRARWRTAVGLAAAGLVGSVALAGCGADGGSDTSGSAADAPAAQPLHGEKGGPGQDAAGGAANPAKLEVAQRSIIYTGSISVRVDDPDAAAQQAVAIAKGANGYVGGDKRSSDGDRSSASLELRVPADRFTDVVDKLAGLGEKVSREINTRDVTEQVVDLDARIATQKTSVTRTRALLTRANSIAEIVEVEGELTKREAELAALLAKQQRLTDLASLSTITLELLGPEAAVVEDDEPDTGFVAGLKAGWKAFLVSMEVLLTVLGALLPWLIALGAPIYGLVWLVRRLNRNRPRPAPVGPSHGGPPHGNPPHGGPAHGTPAFAAAGRFAPQPHQRPGAAPAPSGPATPGNPPAPGGPSAPGNPPAPGGPATPESPPAAPPAPTTPAPQPEL